MYPSDKYPSYGVFVKNIVDNLKEFYQYNIDESVLRGKSASFYSKLFSYVRFYLVSFFRAVFIKYDFIYVHYISHSFLPILLARLFRNQTVIINVHGGDVTQHAEVSNFYFKFKKFIAKAAIHHADLVIVPSYAYVDIVVNSYGCNREKVIISASGGINSNVFYSRKKSIDSSLLKLGYVGRFEPVKGVSLLIDTAKLLKAKNVNFSLELVGDGSLKAKLLADIRREHLSTYVTLYEQCSQNTLAQFYSNFDVLIFPSLSESLGLVGLEAMSCGCLVIASDIDGIKSYLTHGVNGLLFKKSDVNDLLDKIIEFTALPQTDLNQYTANAIATAKIYERKNQTKLLVDLINRVVIDKAGINER